MKIVVYTHESWIGSTIAAMLGKIPAVDDHVLLIAGRKGDKTCRRNMMHVKKIDSVQSNDPAHCPDEYCFPCPLYCFPCPLNKVTDSLDISWTSNREDSLVISLCTSPELFNSM